ncbi:ABC transporter substrate-binding protein [Nocardioides psychrotolerans]|uniref:ABC transporter substrate-binding protein n=1 Tax=Nocardioides psychrotolerans TaxID=1005945 RepID=UPI0031384435
MSQPRGRLTTLLPVLMLLLVGVLAACGSRMSPETVAQLEGGSAALPGQAEGGTVVGAAGADTTGGTGTSPLPGAPGSVPEAGAPVGGTDRTGGGASADGGAAAPTEENAPGGGGEAGGCEGFTNQTGITDKTITIANASDISGPVPGLMQAGQDAVRAYAAYFNSTSDICGRKLEVLLLDSRTDAAADQLAYTKACDQAFAAVGSMSAFDSGGAATAQACGLPDLRAASASLERSKCTTCFGAMSLKANEFENAVPDWVKANYPDAARKAAYVWINAGAVPANANYQADAMEQRGLDFIVRQGIDISEFNYAPYVQELKDAGVEYVQFLGSSSHSVRMAQAMQQQGYKPDLFMMSQPMYEQGYIAQAGAAAEDTHIFITHVPFEEASSSPEVSLYLAWLQQVDPGAEPTSYGLFAWSAARLFVEQATALGGKLTRPALIASLKQVTDWTANDAHGPQNVGAKRTGECWRFIKVDGGRWTAAGARDYSCRGTTVVPE